MTVMRFLYRLRQTVFFTCLPFIPKEALCKVTVSEIRCGLSRIKVPEQENCYYHAPSIAFYGTPENQGIQTGKTYYYSEKLELLLLLNALDGNLFDDVDVQTKHNDAFCRILEGKT